MRTSSAPALLGSFVLGVLLAACGGSGSGTVSTSGGGATSGGFANFDLFVSDAPAEDLLAFQLTITGVHLVLQSGGETLNLLTAPVELELLGLQDRSAWLASESVPPGNYRGLHLVFQHGAYSARRNNGLELPVGSSSDELTLQFAAPLAFDDANYHRVRVDFDMDEGLSGSLEFPPLLFTPVATLSDDHGETLLAIDELDGFVHTSSPAQDALVLRAFADDDAESLLGDVRVELAPDTVLVQDGGALFASHSAFFAALHPNSTRLEVHGAVHAGVLQATRIEIDDNAAGGGSSNLVRLEGLVLAIGPGPAFEVAIVSVPEGSAIVSAASGDAIPPLLVVHFDESTHFYLHEQQPTDSTALALGQRVEVKFASFANAPFLASRVEIEDETAENEGTISNVLGLPDHFVVRFDADAPALLSGQIPSTSADVRVLVEDAPITLGTQAHPSLTVSQLLPGLHVGVHGTVRAPSDAPSVVATELVVHPGKLVGATVGTVVHGPNPTFTTSGGAIVEPFGSGVGDGPLTVLLDPACVFQGAAHSQAEFLALTQGPPGSSSVLVTVRGLSTGEDQVIRAYAITSSLDL